MVIRAPRFRARPSLGQSIDHAGRHDRSRQVQGQPHRRRGRGRDGAGRAVGRVRRGADRARWPTAATAPSTRCSPRWVGRGARRRVTGPLGDPVDAEWAQLSDGTAVVEMARASGLLLVDGRNDPLRATHAGHRRADRRGAAGRGEAGGGRRGRQRDHRRRPGRGRGARLVAARGRGDRGLRRDHARSSTRPGSSARRRGRPTPRWRCSPDGSSGSPSSTSRAPASTSGDLEGGGAAGGLAGGLAAIGAKVDSGLRRGGRRGRPRATRSTAADLVLTGEGKLDATSFAGKVVGGVLDWAAELGVPHRGVIAGQVTAEAREEAQRAGARRSRRSSTASGSRARPSPAPATLVEEAAVDLARRALA